MRLSNQRFQQISDIINAPRGVIGNTLDDSNRAEVAVELLEELTTLRDILSGAEVIAGFSGNALVIDEIERTEEDRVYLRLNKHFDLKITKTDEGVVLDIFSWDSSGDSIASTYAFDQEAIDEIEEPEDE